MKAVILTKARLRRDFECLGIDYNAFYPGETRLQALEELQSAPEVSEYQVFFYHSDHASTTLSTSLGSSSFITDINGDATQHLQYTCTELVECVPFGEDWSLSGAEGHEQNTAAYLSPYTFSSKERDVEMRSIREDLQKASTTEQTNLSYFGARYAVYPDRGTSVGESSLSVWLSVDPMADKYPGMSAYCYTGNSPVIFTDPDGRDWYQSESGAVLWRKGNAANIEVKGETYKNIGAKYSQNIGKGVSITYDQNNAVGLEIQTMDNDQWVSQYSRPEWKKTGCKKACDEMMSNAGTSAQARNDKNQQVGKEVSTADNYKIIPTSNVSNGLKRLNANIEGRGTPTLVGVDHSYGNQRNDGTTDHFVVITGKSIDLQTKSETFRFFEPGTRYPAKGTSSNNTLKLGDDGLLRGGRYTVTNIR